MTRNQCERKLAQKIKELWEIYQEYNPDGKYLSVAITDGNPFHCNNEYYNADRLKKITFHGSVTNLKKVVYHDET